MKISAKTDYACRALLELGMHWPSEAPLQINEIAERQKIPIKFLIHIMIQLKQLGYVESTRGKRGGYILVKHPSEVKLSHVIKGFGGLGHHVPAENKKQFSKHVLNSLWQEIDQSILQLIDKINFEQLCDRARSKDRVITYEI